MRQAGFVLVGGKSTRMGRDKALLPWKGTTLARNAARIVEEACGSAALIGDPVRYSQLGYPVFADRFAGCGPMGGIATALAVSDCDWNLVTGCDMPALTPEVLRLLLHEAREAGGGAVFPVSDSGPEPLCAVYHRGCLPALERAIAAGRFRMRDAVAVVNPRLVTGMDPAIFANLNTPEDFEEFTARP